MKEFLFTIRDPAGLHARPAGLLVKQAAGFQSRITIKSNGKTVDAKRLIMLMSLGLKQGTEITCRIEGEDEEAASDGLLKFLRENL